MTYRIYLTESGKRNITTAQEQQYGEMRDVSRLCGVKIDGSKGEEPYIESYSDPNDPTTVFPVFPAKFIKFVTFKEIADNGFVEDGLYKYRGATVRVETSVKVHAASFEKPVVEVSQSIQIRAGSIRTLREAYIKVRSGELKPNVGWGIKKGHFDSEALALIGAMLLSSGAESHGFRKPMN